ncbi:hypothetical protein BBD42_27015 [Paenibacillus sp. BIHB 4019]|uniref:Bacteriophage lambda Replication protein O N-terminal domain-containing protein n=1 Tax=Paenibacillus sp. BIHB 4019 TaxID=1870819 RepID=A0A1B2DPU8_9BACL|nr:hypothetical protein [Paenibacillus sp. BIHB 4019]ANY69735.1 hypothetical protein BBD42_27015 [Paenibacillus sp. BIHB 4019]
MSRKKKKDYSFRPFEKATSSIDNHHIRITRNMMESVAWKELSVHAVVLYLAMKTKYTGSNENDISFTYAEGEKLMNKATFTKSMDQLIENGFIQIIRQGWSIREPNIYGFHTMWQLFGTKHFEVKPRIKRQPKQ